MFNELSHVQKNYDWDLNGDGRLSLNEANNWYRNGNGVSIDVNLDKSLVVLELENRDIVLGKDVAVYGQVILKSDGTLAPDTYNFDIKPNNTIFNRVRNLFTKVGHQVAGRGNKYKIRFHGEPTVW